MSYKAFDTYIYCESVAICFPQVFLNIPRENLKGGFNTALKDHTFTSARQPRCWRVLRPVAKVLLACGQMRGSLHCFDNCVSNVLQMPPLRCQNTCLCTAGSHYVTPTEHLNHSALWEFTFHRKSLRMNKTKTHICNISARYKNTNVTHITLL